MKPIDAFLAELSQQNVKIVLDGEQLRVASKAALTTELVEQLRRRKPEILHFLQQSVKKGTHTIQPAARHSNLPLSYAQERLWFLNQLEAESSAYHMPMALRLVGHLDVTALEQSLQALVRRHESLRTTFVTLEGGSPLGAAQVIGAPDFHLASIDLTPLPDAAQAIEIKRLAAEDAQRPFNLAAGPLFRATLLRLRSHPFPVNPPQPAEQVLLLNMHHIVSDGWSMGIFMRELAALYAAFLAGKPSPLPDLPIQYADFAVWQRAWLEGEIMAEQLAYWRRQLADAPPTLNLPQDFPRLAQPTFRGGHCARQVALPLTDRLKALSRQHEVTLFVTLLATFKLLLARLAGEEDVVVGTPVAGRNRVELEGLIGFFLNSLALRTDLSGNPSFGELLQRVRRVTLEAFTHQDIPFEKLVAELQPARHLNHSPFFQVLFNLAPAQAGMLQLPGLRVENAVELDDERAKFDLTLYVTETAEGIELQAVYHAELFAAIRIAHLLDQYHHLLEQIGRDAARSIDSYSLVTPQAQALLPDPTLQLPEPAYAPVPQRIAMWAERAPTQIAVAQGNQTWSYQDLVQQAAAVAQALQADGVREGDVVALWGERRFGLIAALLGVLSSGGVLLTLNPQSPRPPLEFMLKETRARHLIFLADEPLPAWLEAYCPHVLRVDPQRGIHCQATEAASLCLPGPSPAAPAYIFFTSGTTGVPKGVLGAHQGLAHFLDWQRQAFGIDIADRAAQLTQLSFDVVLRDILVALVSGGALVLPPSQELMDGRQLFNWLAQEQITLLHTVPSLAQAWLADVPAGVTCPSLRRVFFAGEPLVDSVVRQWRMIFPNCEMINLYGPTETTLAKCFYRVPEAPLPGVQPVGFPLPETQALVLRETRLCGVGEPGEIVIRTPFRTRGYLNNPEEQHRRFRRNPYTGDDNDLLYYTGDSGRYRPDGSIAILGRRDDQVKIRGVRVELRGIEALLSQHPAVQQCVVIPVGEGWEKRLVAYVRARPAEQATGSSALQATTLRQYLQAQLPDSMLPAAFVLLDALPLTPSGKVNYGALPAPPLTGAPGARLLPRTPQEQRLVQIWEEVLGVAPIGIRDSFFDLGGHSLLAVRLISKIKEAFAHHLPVGALFQHPTVEALAQLLHQAADPAIWSPLVAIQPGGSKPPFFCLPGLGGNVLYLHALASHLGQDQPFYALQTVGLDGVTPPYTTVEAIVDRYLTEIRRVQPRGPYRLGGHSWGGKVAFAMAQQLVKAGEPVNLLALFDSTPPGMNEPTGVLWNEVEVIAEMLAGLKANYDANFTFSPALLAESTSEERLYRLRDCLEKTNQLPPGVDILQVRGMVNVYQANLRLLYTPQAVVPTPILFFAARDTGDEMIRRKVEAWSQLSPITVQQVPGAHVNLLWEPHVQTLAEVLAACLADSQSLN